MLKVYVGGYINESSAIHMRIIQECQRYLYQKVGNYITVSFDGRSNTYGSEFVKHWNASGGRYISCDTKGVVCALYIDGDAKDATDMKQFQSQGIPVIAFRGSGGASGGLIAGEGGWLLEESNGADRLYIAAPALTGDHKHVAAALISEVLAILNPNLPKHMK